MYTATDLLPYFLRTRQLSTDTRTISPGTIFLALKGPRFDGNQYAAMALEKGAPYVVVDDPSVIPAGDERYLLVENGLRALQGLATAYRRTFDSPMLGLTGSNGKTTTKELISAVLSTTKRVHATKGNLNNHIGVPLTLLSMPEDTEIAVIEMGANQPGDIQELAEIAEPTHGLITNVGYAHIERLGSLDGVQETKGALFDFVASQAGTLFVNVADQRVWAAAREAHPRITYGSADADYWIEVVENRLDGMRLHLHSQHWSRPLRLDSSLSGPHNAHNMLAAAAVGHQMGINPEDIQAGIASYHSANNRSQLMKRGQLTIWLDAYNANPSSMRASIQHVFSVDSGRVALLLGDMYELGEAHLEMHAALGRFINEFQPACCIGVGEDMQAMVEEVNTAAYAYPDVEALSPDLPALLANVDTLLIKGSRAMALERVLEVLPPMA